MVRESNIDSTWSIHTRLYYRITRYGLWDDIEPWEKDICSTQQQVIPISRRHGLWADFDWYEKVMKIAHALYILGCTIVSIGMGCWMILTGKRKYYR